MLCKNFSVHVILFLAMVFLGRICIRVDKSEHWRGMISLVINNAFGRYSGCFVTYFSCKS